MPTLMHAFRLENERPCDSDGLIIGIAVCATDIILFDGPPVAGGISPPELASLQKTRFFACFTIITNASIDILQNGWPEICCVTVSTQDIMQKNKKTTHLHTTSPTHLYKSHIHPQKGWAAAKPPPTPFEDSYLCTSASVILCVGV